MRALAVALAVLLSGCAGEAATSTSPPVAILAQPDAQPARSGHADPRAAAGSPEGNRGAPCEIVPAEIRAEAARAARDPLDAEAAGESEARVTRIALNRGAALRRLLALYDRCGQKSR